MRSLIACDKAVVAVARTAGVAPATQWCVRAERVADCKRRRCQAAPRA